METNRSPQAVPYPRLRLNEEPGQEVVGLLPRLADLWCGGLAQDGSHAQNKVLPYDRVVLRPHVCEDVLVGDSARRRGGGRQDLPTAVCSFSLTSGWRAPAR